LEGKGKILNYTRTFSRQYSVNHSNALVWPRLCWKQ